MSMYADALGTEPAEIVRAENYEAVQQAVCRAAEAKQAIIPWGGGTAQTYGYLPERADILLDLSPMNRVLAHEPGDLTVTVEAGATLQAVQDALAEKNQFLPIDAGHPEQATVGGIIAADAWGAGRTGYGTVRDWLLGLTVVDAHGKIVKGGGKVVKNVTGYDTPKLHVGGLGTLGVIVEATFKVAPRPEAARPLLFILPNGDAADLAPFLARLLRETAPTFAVLQDEAEARVLAVLYAGYEAVANHEAEVGANLAREFGLEAAPGLPRAVSHPLAPASADDTAPLLIAQTVGRPANAAAQHQAFARLGFQGAKTRVVTHPATGHTTFFLFGWRDTTAETLGRQMIQWAGETQTPLAFLHAPNRLRGRASDFPIWSPIPPALPLMQKLKQTLDPENTLNPGRFLV